MEMEEDKPTGVTLKVENEMTAVKNCALCGCSTPAVKCDRCSSQMFCLSCDDMYHRHPKRKFHLRKAVDSIWSSRQSPRLRRRTELPGDPSKIPIPPPRTKKRPSAPSLGTFNPKLDVPRFGLKNALAKKTALGSQNDILGIRTPSPFEADYQNASRRLLNEEGNFKTNKSSSPAKTALELGVQRRNSADNPNFVPNASLPEQVAFTGAVTMNAPDRNFLGYQPPLQGQNTQHSISATDLTAPSAHPMCQFPQHLHAFMHPQINPYSMPLANFNCPQCSPALWSNIMNPNMVHYHAHPWNAQGMPGSQGQTSPMPTDAVTHNDESSVTHIAALDSGSCVPLQNQNGMPNTAFDKSCDTRYEKIAYSPSPMVEQSPSDEEIAKAQVAQLLESEAEESAEEDTGYVVERLDIDARAVIPEKPAEPWTCIHCTYINPPGSHVCEVCCKTSYNSEENTQKTKSQKTRKNKSASPQADNDIQETIKDKPTQTRITPSSSGRFEQVMQSC